MLRLSLEVVGLGVPNCELFGGRSRCKEPSDYTVKFVPITCGRPTQLGVRTNVYLLTPPTD